MHFTILRHLNKTTIDVICQIGQKKVKLSFLDQSRKKSVVRVPPGATSRSNETNLQLKLRGNKLLNIFGTCYMRYKYALESMLKNVGALEGHLWFS